MTREFVIIGPGKVGTALGQQLARAGYTPLAVAARKPASAQKAAEAMGAGHATTIPWEITPRAGIVFITTPDSAIAETCETIARHNGFKNGAVVLHCSGSLPSTILNVHNSSSTSAGAFKGSMHPLQSFAGGDIAGNPFDGINMAIEGESTAVETAHDIGNRLGATCFTIKTAAKGLYHASAVVASNYLVTLMEVAFSLLDTAGIDRANAPGLLWPLVRGTLSNIESVGIPEALTGPIARGDTETVESHLKEIAEQQNNVLDIYAHLGRCTIPLAVAKGTITNEQAGTLKKLLDRLTE